MIKIKVVLFASLSEALGKSELSLEMPVASTVSDLIEMLGQSQGACWLEKLTADNVLTAVNHCMVESKHALKNDDEVAFLPPVTGG